jgi:hypothetical protein
MSRQQQQKKKPSTDPTPATREALADRPFAAEPPEQASEALAQPEQAIPAAGHSIAAAPARVGHGKGRTLQAKLTVGAADDPYEQEADRVAAQVVAGKAPPRVQRAATASVGVDVTPEVEAGVAGLRGGGQPLAPETRSLMENRIGHSFGDVRVHTDAQAGDLADQVRARAFTVGSDVAFAPGTYKPDSAEGQRLLAHELTHVVQQGEAVIRREPGDADTDVETDAAPPAADAAPVKPMLKLGSSGDSVKEAQQSLNDHGATPPLVVDGIFGPKTMAATRAYQGGHGLVKDGIIGPKTWSSLGEAPSVTTTSISETTDTGNKYTQDLVLNKFKARITIELGVNWGKKGTWADDAAFNAFIRRAKTAVYSYMDNKFKVVCTPTAPGAGSAPIDLPIDVLIYDFGGGYSIEAHGGLPGGDSFMTQAGGKIFEKQSSGSAENDITYAHEFGHAMLGASDEYVNPAVPGRVLTNDHSIMANYYTQGINQAAFKARHFQHIVTEVSKAFAGYTCSIKPM